MAVTATFPVIVHRRPFQNKARMLQPVGAATATPGAGAKSDEQRGYTLQATFRAKEGFQSHPPFRFPLLSSPPPKAPAGGSPPRQATPTEGRSALYGTLTKGHRPLEPANRAPIGCALKLPLWTGIMGVSVMPHAGAMRHAKLAR